jgi:hypothetical protein
MLRGAGRRALSRGQQKFADNPMDQGLGKRSNNLRQAPRCGAMTRAGTACQRPAINGRKRCRLHGGLSPGAPRGLRNGNFKNGDWTSDAIAERRWLRSLVRSFADHGRSKMNTLVNSPRCIADEPRLPPVRVRLLQPDLIRSRHARPTETLRIGRHASTKRLARSLLILSKRPCYNSERGSFAPWHNFGNSDQCRTRHDRSCRAKGGARGSARRRDGLYSRSSNGRTC